MLCAVASRASYPVKIGMRDLERCGAFVYCIYHDSTSIVLVLNDTLSRLELYRRRDIQDTCPTKTKFTKASISV